MLRSLRSLRPSNCAIYLVTRDGSIDLLAVTTSISQLKVTFPGGMPKAESIDKGLSILIYVGDMATPRAVVRVADLIRQRGVRPLNIQMDGPMRVVLADPTGIWSKVVPAIEVSVKVN